MGRRTITKGEEGRRITRKEKRRGAGITITTTVMRARIRARETSPLNARAARESTRRTSGTLNAICP